MNMLQMNSLMNILQLNSLMNILQLNSLMNILQLNSLMNILQLNSLMNILQLNTFLFFLQSSRFSLNIFKITSRVISSDTLCKVDNVLFLKAHIVVYFMSQEIEALPQIQILNSLYLRNLYLFKHRSFDPTEVIV